MNHQHTRSLNLKRSTCSTLMKSFDRPCKITSVKAQLLFQQTRMLNLGLMIRYGPNLWKNHDDQIDSTTNVFNDVLQHVCSNANQTNKTRKLSQILAVRKLNRL